MAFKTVATALVFVTACVVLATADAEHVKGAGRSLLQSPPGGPSTEGVPTYPSHDYDYGTQSAPSSVTTTTHKSWGQELMDSFTGVIIGIVLLLSSFPVLIWNERKAARIYRILTAARNAVRRNVPCDRINHDNDGKLVHMVGPMDTAELLQDTQLGLAFPRCVKYRRNVEMFQWVETKRTKEEDKLGGGKETTTTYTYSQEWRATLQDSSSFQIHQGHENPSSWPVRHEVGQVNSIGFGHGRPAAFMLSAPLIAQIQWFQHRDLTQADFDNLTPEWRDRLSLRHGGTLYLSTHPAYGREGFQQASSSPRIGDVTIRYEQIPVGTVSVMGRQRGPSFTSWTPPAACNCCGTPAVHEDEEMPLMGKYGAEELEISAGCCDQMRGREDVLYCDEGECSAAQMISLRASANTACTWVFRIVGFMMMWVGMNLILGPIVAFAKVWPFLSKLIGAGLTLATGVLSLVLTLITAAIGWIFARPVVVVGLLTFAAGIVALVQYA